MRRSRLHKAPIWPWLLWAAICLAILVVGLGFRPRETQFLDFAAIVACWFIQAVWAAAMIARARLRAARGIVDMVPGPDPARGEFA